MLSCFSVQDVVKGKYVPGVKARISKKGIHDGSLKEKLCQETPMILRSVRTKTKGSISRTAELFVLRPLILLL